jgi:hypothetical protein
MQYLNFYDNYSISCAVTANPCAQLRFIIGCGTELKDFFLVFWSQETQNVLESLIVKFCIIVLTMLAIYLRRAPSIEMP